jgi:hypothetical protein
MDMCLDIYHPLKEYECIRLTQGKWSSYCRGVPKCEVEDHGLMSYDIMYFCRWLSNLKMEVIGSSEMFILTAVKASNLTQCEIAYELFWLMVKCFVENG